MTIAPHQKQNHPSIHHKKRYGQHHNKNAKHYKKTYWPYLPIALIVALGLGVNIFWGNANAHVLGQHTNISDASLLQATNRQRATHGDSILDENAKLDKAAQTKANDMAKRNYWSHVTPDGKQPWVFFKAAGYHYEMAGENLAYGFTSTGGVIAGWMQSPEHRANILNKYYQDVGFGIAHPTQYQGGGPTTIIVAEYGKPASAVASATVTPAANPPTTAPLPQSQAVSRVQTISGGVPWSVFVVTLIAAVAATVFVVRHVYFWRRVLVHGEHWIIRHRKSDMLIVAVAMAGMVLAQASGFIH
jgi:hypothetical protein